MIAVQTLEVMLMAVAVLAAPVSSETQPATGAKPAAELDEHAEKFMKAQVDTGAGHASAAPASALIKGAGDVRFALVTVSFTDAALAEKAGLDVEAIRTTARDGLTAPTTWVLRAREQVNLSVPHWWVESTVALGGSASGDRYLYHVTTSLLRLSLSESTPKQNRYVKFEQRSQKHIADSDAAGLQKAVEKSIADLAARIAPRLAAPVEAANSSDRTPLAQ